MPSPAEIDARLTAHLQHWLGAWPPAPGVHVVGHAARAEPSWDGTRRDFVGVATPTGAVLSVPPALVAPLAAVVAAGIGTDTDLTDPAVSDALGPAVIEAYGRPGAFFGGALFRWSNAPTASDDPGVWLPTDDPRLPDWLRPFNGDVLVALVGDQVAAGVGRKQHDAHGHELAVVTEEGFRGQGFAQRLVTQAARRVIADGAVPTYLHAADNVASARTAVASGFPDQGWRILGLFGGE